MPLPSQKKFLLPIFFLSGFSALVYEVIWARMLALVYGSTVEAVSAVVTAFMAGLAMGSYFMGRWIDKRDNTLLIYSITEFGIAIASLSLYFIIIFIPDIHSTFHNIVGIETSFILFHDNGYILEFLLVFVPTTLMGATFPLMVKSYISSRNHVGEGVSIIYTVNTLGAVLGAFLTGFFLIPAIGVRATVYTAVAINLVLATAAFLIRRFHSPSIPPSLNIDLPAAMSGNKHLSGPLAPSPLVAASVLTVLTLSGFASLGYQIAWTRVLTMVIGNSVYAFSAILTTFLLGITIGSFAFIRQIDRIKDKVLLLGILQLLLCLFVLIILPMFDSLPSLFLLLYRYLPPNFLNMVSIQFIVTFSAIIIPTILMGASFPVAARIYIGTVDNIGEGLGRLYSANTVGAIFGSFLTGFVFIPTLGAQKTIFLISALNLISGIVLLLQVSRLRLTVRVVASVSLIAIFTYNAASIRNWNKDLLNMGIYLYAKSLKDLPETGVSLEEIAKQFKLIYYEEGRNGTVSVSRTGYDLSLQINGKTDAGTRKEDMLTQSMIAALPLIIHPDPINIAIIGLGSGITLGTADTFPVKKVDCIELLPEVINANRYFSSFNHNALNNPKNNIIIADGRQHLSTKAKEYDVIINQPSNPWITGVSNLFTLEYFQIASKGLKKDGIMCQWLQLYALDTSEVKSLLHTFKTVFHHVDVWAFSPEEIIVIGSNAPILLDEHRLNTAFSSTEIYNELLRVGIKTPEEFKAAYLMGDKEVQEFSKGAKLNTDDRPVIEFEAPKALYRSMAGKNISAILSSITVLPVHQKIRD